MRTPWALLWVISLIAVNQEVTRSEEHGRFLLVRTGSLRCALPASDVVRVVRGLMCHPVPGSQARLLGLAQYGGEPLPVLDLHALVERTASGTRHRSTVILGRGRRRDRSVLGLAVDEVLRVVGLGELGKIAAADSEGNLVTGTATLEGAPVSVLDTRRLLEDESNDPGAMNV